MRRKAATGSSPALAPVSCPAWWQASQVLTAPPASTVAALRFAPIGSQAPSGVTTAGFADRIPSNAEVYSGGANAMKVDRTSQALVFWATMAGLKPGDFVALRVLGPDGRELANRTQKLESHRIRSWLAVGRSAKGEWPSGRYQGMVTVHRDEPAGPREIQRVVPLEIR